MGDLDPTFAKNFISALWSSTAEEVSAQCSLVDHGALQRYRQTDKGSSLLHLAVRRARKTTRVDRLRRRAGDLAVMQEICRILVEDVGIDLHCTDAIGQTVLYWACAFGADDLCRFLLQKGADVCALNSHGETALFAASRWSEHHCVNLLLKEKVDPCVKNKIGQTAMTVTGQKTAMMVTNEPRIKKDLQKEVLITLHKALKCYPKQANSLEALRLDDFGRNALFYASSKGSTQWLLERKCSPHLKDSSMRTPLHWAAAKGANEKIRELLRAQADANDQDAHGQTPLFQALAAGSPEACQSLLDAGCDSLVLDEHGVSVFKEARARVAQSADRKEYKAAVEVANVIAGSCSKVLRMFSRRQPILSKSIRPGDMSIDANASPRRLRSVSATPSELLRPSRDQQKKVRAVRRQRSMRDKKATEEEQKASRRPKQRQRRSKRELVNNDTSSRPAQRSRKELACDARSSRAHAATERPAIKEEEIFLQPKVRPQKPLQHELPVVDENFKKRLQERLDKLDDDHLESIMDFLGNAIDGGEEESSIDLDNLPPEKLKTLLGMVDDAEKRDVKVEQQR